MKDLIIEIPVDDIALGYADDGLPITVPASKLNDKTVVVAEDREEKPEKLAKVKDDKPAVTLAQLEAANRERDAEREARTKAEAEAKAAREAAESLTGKLGKTETILHDRTIQTAASHYHVKNGAYTSVVNGIQQAKSEQIMARKALKSAKEAGDVDGEVEAAERLATLAAHLATIENYLPTAEAELDQAKRLWQDVNTAPVVKEEPKPKTEVEAKKADEAPKTLTADQWIENVKSAVGDEGAAWLKSHKDYVTDPKLNRKLTRFADEYADDHGQEALKSKKFIEALNAKFDPQTDEEEPAVAEEDEGEEETIEIEKPAPKAKKAMSSAPVSRNSSYYSSRNTEGAKIKLSPRLVAAAAEIGEDPTTYALNARRAIKEGKLPKNFLDPDYVPGA